MKSNLEKESILNSYKSFLKSCDFNLQILVQSKKENFNLYNSRIKKQIQKENNENIINFFNSYIDYINSNNSINNSSSKNFYIVYKVSNENDIYLNSEIIFDKLNEQYLKIKDALSRCGNLILELNNKREVEDIIKSFYNPKNNM